MFNDGIFFQDPEEYYYIYAQTMNDRRQYGIVACASIDDYFNDVIKKHELTRPDKEEDRKNHIRYSNLNNEPVFFAYPANSELDQLTNTIIKDVAEYDFQTKDGIGHTFWISRNSEINNKITTAFEKLSATYVADGHHRTAAAARIGLEKQGQNSNHTGNEEYNFFMAVHFPDNQLQIIDYNRTVKDLNGLSEEALLENLAKDFNVEKAGSTIYKPAKLHEFSMYLSEKWYKLTAKPETFNDNDPIGVLDVTILSNLVLDQILGIDDLRTSTRIDFVGGIRGLGELKKRVDKGDAKVAFALFPVSMQQLINIADSGNIMPPKTTWFEPKLRSGLVIHKLD